MKIITLSSKDEKTRWFYVKPPVGEIFAVEMKGKRKNNLLSKLKR